QLRRSEIVRRGTVIDRIPARRFPANVKDTRPKRRAHGSQVAHPQHRLHGDLRASDVQDAGVLWINTRLSSSPRAIGEVGGVSRGVHILALGGPGDRLCGSVAAGGGVAIATCFPGATAGSCLWSSTIGGASRAIRSAPDRPALRPPPPFLPGPGRYLAEIYA